MALSQWLMNGGAKRWRKGLIVPLLWSAMAGAAPMVDVLHEGYVKPIEGKTFLPGAAPDGARKVASTITLVRNGTMVLVADPGMTAAGEWPRVIEKMRQLGVAPEAVTHVFISHHHPDHNTRVGVFPNAKVVDFWATYQDDHWQDHPDNYAISPGVTVIRTPGHTDEDASLLVETAQGTYLLTHIWWSAEGPEIDPLGSSQKDLEQHRGALLKRVDWIIPGHGKMYKNTLKPR